jgi:hypothetical protein
LPGRDTIHQETNMPKYMVIPRDPPQGLGLSPAEMQQIIQKYMDWTKALAQAGKLDHGNKLKDGEGRVIGKVGGEKGPKWTVTDGPYTESKEIMGGYWILSAANYDEAVKLVSDSPHLQFGTLEVREVDEL